MKIGFLLKWNKNTGHKYGWTIGEAYYVQSLCQELLKFPQVQSAEPFDIVNGPKTKLDVMIHVNATTPVPSMAKKNILYLQNGYWQGMDNELKQLRPLGYDGYLFISKKLLTLHIAEGYQGLYLPFGVDLSVFYPRDPVESFNYEVAYVGNDIKGSKKTSRYLLPALNYNFGLYGRWHDGSQLYQHILSRFARGALPYHDLPFLYSSTKININFTFQDQVNWGAMTDRPLQVMACKGFLLTDYLPEEEKELQNCMVVTTGSLDMLNKIDYYLSRPKERQEIAENGYQYTMRHASLKSVACKLFEYLTDILS